MSWLDRSKIEGRPRWLKTAEQSTKERWKQCRKWVIDGTKTQENLEVMKMSYILIGIEGNGTHSSVLAWRTPGTVDPGGLQSMGLLRSDTTERLHFHFSLSCIGERNSNPLQCSCLENPRDGEAWWAAVYGVAQSQTRLKWLSLYKEMGTHSGALAWKIPWMENPGRLQSMGSQRVGHDWATLLSFLYTWVYAFIKIYLTT